jgi:hypothetical protein
MANIRVATTVRNAMLDAINTALNAGSGAGTIKIYSGTQPANGDAAESGTLLATLTLTDPAAGAASAGVLTLSTITEDASADATATATWARLEDSAGTNVFDGDVGTASAMINLNTTAIVTGGPVRITSFTITMPSSITF